MKKIIFSLTLATLLISCKEETREKVKEASKAVTSDMKIALDSAKVKASKVIDTAKRKDKVKSAIEKGAEKVEQGAKKLKEAVKK
jgi:PBP1b-binding outer membrane lipoprotein LpoB